MFRLFDNGAGEDIGWWVNSTEPNNTYARKFNGKRNSGCFVDEWYTALNLHLQA